MSAIPVTPNSTDNDNIRITNKQGLFVFRILWIALLIFEISVMSYLIPLSAQGQYENDERYNQVAMAPLREVGLLELSWTLNKGLGIFHATICVGLATILMWRSHKERTAVLFSFILLTLVTSIIPNPIGILPVFISDLNELLFNIGLIALIYLFPDGRFFPKSARFIFGGFVIVFCVVQFTVENTGESVSAFIFFVLTLFLGVGTMVLRYRQARQRQRQQMKWLVSVLIFFPLLMVLWAVSYATLGDIFPLVQIFLAFVGSLLIIGVPLSVGLSVLRYGLWNIDLVINQSLVYGSVTLLLVITFGISIVALQQFLGATNVIASYAISAIPPILLFNPTRKHLQNLVDHRIYGLRYNLNQIAVAQKSLQIKNAGFYTGRRFGKYETLDVIGRGGMGEVYKGFADGETVAIKILPPDLAHSGQAWKRFEREAQTLYSLQHPYIVSWRASGVSDGIPYLVMEYVRGEELSVVIKQGKLRDYESLFDWMSNISEALDYAHEQGFIHRDLKPSNIMLRQKEGSELTEAILMDFGIARSLSTISNLTGTGVLGTIDYMAPEQILDSKEVDKRADIYALGVILYELVTGERPYKGNAGQIVFAHLQQPVPYLRDIYPDIPHHFAYVIEKAMAKDPNDRYSSASEFLAHLRPIIPN